MARRFPALKERYSGPPRLIEKELLVDYGKRWRDDKYSVIEGSGLEVFVSSTWQTEKTIFVENCGDLFAEGIPGFWTLRILRHCLEYIENTYVFQTKNPGRVSEFLFIFPPRFMIGTTAESNRYFPISNAPRPTERLMDLERLNADPSKKFITIEPILQFDFGFFLNFLKAVDAQTIYIGADSKGHRLPEPTSEEIKALIRGLRDAGRTVVLKSNLKRIYKEEY